MNADKRALLLIAHGSRLPEANTEVAELTDRLREATGDRYEIVTHAFLEIAEPDIPTGIDVCVAQGAAQLWVLPYFWLRAVMSATTFQPCWIRRVSGIPTYL